MLALLQVLLILLNILMYSDIHVCIATRKYTVCSDIDPIYEQ